MLLGLSRKDLHGAIVSCQVDTVLHKITAERYTMYIGDAEQEGCARD